MIQIENIKQALLTVPDSATQADALLDLETLKSTLEVQGVRILQLNNMIPLDERGNPATQEYVDALLCRPRIPSSEEVRWILNAWGVPESEHGWLSEGLRARYVLEVWECLRALMPEARMAESWMSRPNDNSLFRGEPPLKVLLRPEGLGAIHALLMGRLNNW